MLDEIFAVVDRIYALTFQLMIVTLLLDDGASFNVIHSRRNILALGSGEGFPLGGSARFTGTSEFASAAFAVIVRSKRCDEAVRGGCLGARKFKELR